MSARLVLEQTSVTTDASNEGQISTWRSGLSTRPLRLKTAIAPIISKAQKYMENAPAAAKPKNAEIKTGESCSPRSKPIRIGKRATNI